MESGLPSSDTAAPEEAKNASLPATGSISQMPLQEPARPDQPQPNAQAAPASMAATPEAAGEINASAATEAAPVEAASSPDPAAALPSNAFEAAPGALSPAQEGQTALPLESQPALSAPSSASEPLPAEAPSTTSSGEVQAASAPRVVAKAVVRMKMPSPIPASSVVPTPAPGQETTEWERPVSPVARVKAMIAGWIALIPPRVRLGLGIASAPLGALLGAQIAFILIRHNYNAVVVPSALGGILCGLISGRKSWRLGLYSALVGLVAGLLTEHQLAPRALSTKSFSYFLSHLSRVGANPLLLLAAGVVIGFVCGVGRSRTNEQTEESQ